MQQQLPQIVSHFDSDTVAHFKLYNQRTCTVLVTSYQHQNEVFLLNVLVNHRSIMAHFTVERKKETTENSPSTVKIVMY